MLEFAAEGEENELAPFRKRASGQAQGGNDFPQAGKGFEVPRKGNLFLACMQPGVCVC